MAINASIPLGVQPARFENRQQSPLNMLAKVMQLDGMQQQNALGQMKMDEMRRGSAEHNALAQVIKVPGFSWDNPEQRQAAFSAAPKYAQELYKGHVELQGRQGENKKRDFEMAKERYGVFQKTVGAQLNNPNLSKQAVVGAVAQLVVSGVMDEKVAESMVNSFPDDPQQLRQAVTVALSSQMTPEQMLTVFAPKPEKIDNGQQIGFRDTNPNSPTYGQMTAGGVVQKQQSPDSVASTSASYANAAATREVAKATRDAARIQTGFKNEQDLRKEFESLPEVKKYKQALPAFKGIEDAVKRNTAQSDINIVYGIAKIYDPDSVVREGEYATVANSPNIPDRIKGYAQYLAGGGRLTPKVKAEILAEATSRMKSFDDQFLSARKDFESIATRSGIDPTKVFPSPVAPVAQGGGGKVVDFGSLK